MEKPQLCAQVALAKYFALNRKKQKERKIAGSNPAETANKEHNQNNNSSGPNGEINQALENANKTTKGGGFLLYPINHLFKDTGIPTYGNRHSFNLHKNTF